MTKIQSSPRFKAAYQKLPPEIRLKVRKALLLLTENPRHPSLQTKPIQGASGVYEARIDRNYRLTYERLPGDVLRLRNPARHSE